MPSACSRFGYSCLSTTSQLVKRGSTVEWLGRPLRAVRRIFANMSPYVPRRSRTESMGVSHSRIASRKGDMMTADEREEGRGEEETSDSENNFHIPPRNSASIHRLAGGSIQRFAFGRCLQILQCVLINFLTVGPTKCALPRYRHFGAAPLGQLANQIQYRAGPTGSHPWDRPTHRPPSLENTV